MKVEIWSDVRCPFCYIGKRKFETALSVFAHKDQVEIVWHSFELDPSLQTDPSLNIYDYLAARKGFSRSRSVEMHEHVVQSACEAGLQFNFDQAVVANSFNAHRLIQLANARGAGDTAEELLFKAYFTEGLNIDDTEVLIRIGTVIGLQEKEVADMLASADFSREVRKDQVKAGELGINGVPFFVVNDAYGVSGAQSPDTFLEVLEHAWRESGETAVSVGITGEVCDADGACNV